MRVAIQCKYLPWTQTKPSRVKAIVGHKQNSVTVSFHTDEDEPEVDGPYRRAAEALLVKMGWDLHLRIASKGVLPKGDYVYTLEEIP